MAESQNVEYKESWREEYLKWICGFANAHLYAGFPHLYWAGTPLPQRFVTAACRYIKEEP